MKPSKRRAKRIAERDDTPVIYTRSVGGCTVWSLTTQEARESRGGWPPRSQKYIWINPGFSCVWCNEPRNSGTPRMETLVEALRWLVEDACSTK